MPAQPRRKKNSGPEPSAFAGEFSVLAYGDGDIDELFYHAQGRLVTKGGLANMKGKPGMVHIILPDGLQMSEFLKVIRTRHERAVGYEEVHGLYWDPAGPVIGVTLDYESKLSAFKDTGIRTPPNAVLFIGTNFIK